MEKDAPKLFHIMRISDYETIDSFLFLLQNFFMKYLFSLVMILLSFSSFSQDKSKVDKIYLNDGSVLEVNVKKVNSSFVEFTYPGEAAQNEEKINNIRTIVFSSGRVQQFNTVSQTTENTAPGKMSIEHRQIEQNILSILPVAFYDKQTGELMEDLSKLAQSRIYDFFEDDLSKISPLKMQDTRNTNAYLKKANLNFAALDETPVEELEKILGTEYLVLSKVTVDTRNNTTVNENTWKNDQKKGDKKTGSTYTTTSVNENKVYNYVVVLEIYKGADKIYNETRKPFLNTEDSWKDAMEYMLKRAPIYKRK